MRRTQTVAEQKLWRLLRDRRLSGLKFRRQVPIGPYIADFLCQRPKLIVEADGGQHSLGSDDQHRDLWFRRAGYQVARYWNHEILENSEGVLLDILAKAGVKLD